MRQFTLIMTLALGLFACSSKTEKQNENQSGDSLQTVLAKQKNPKIFIKDKTKYSAIFINELNNSNYNEPIKLIDDYIVVGKDTTQFPHDLALNQSTIFKATKDNKKYDLTVIRINETTLKFMFKLTDSDKKNLFTETGNATLGAMFFLASEVDEDDQTGDAYGSSEYWKTDNKYRFSVRIGSKDDNGKLRATITYCSNGKRKDKINLDDCPTLRTE